MLTHFEAAGSTAARTYSARLIPGSYALTLGDVFNALNAATVLGRVTRQDASNANYVSTILAPRIVRLGLKVNF